MHSSKSYKKICLALALTAGVFGQVLPGLASGDSVGIGVVSPMPPGAMRPIHIGHAGHLSRVSARTKAHHIQSATAASTVAKTGKLSKKAKLAAAHKKGKKVAAIPMRPPQEETTSMSQETCAPGVVHKFHRGPLSINIIDVDLTNPTIEVKPVLAGDTFSRLDEVRDQAHKVNAIAAVNANYFKKDGTPLGTLVMDGEWVAGPLYDRISFGLTDSGKVHVDRANLHGTVETSNPQVSSLWVNNINQPRRSGCKLVAYTRRWGSEVKMAYAGVLVAVDATGKVVDKSTQTIGIPPGGFVLSDTKNAVITKLKHGDLVFLEWHHKPDSWADVVQAVSGGPALIKNGKLFLDLKDENFRKTWTSNSIHARTALGVTENHHLILTTVEGPHTLWDLAKMLQKMGCVEAMNLDGGGSTTMVVQGNIVTRNKNTFQRRVAASLAVVPRSVHSASIVRRRFAHYVPETDLAEIFREDSSSPSCLLQIPVADPVANEIEQHLLNNEPALPEIAKADAVSTQAAEIVQPIDDNSGKNKKKIKRANSISKSLSNSLNKSLDFSWMKGWLNK